MASPELLWRLGNLTQNPTADSVVTAWALSSTRARRDQCSTSYIIFLKFILLTLL